MQVRELGYGGVEVQHLPAQLAKQTEQTGRLLGPQEVCSAVIGPKEATAALADSPPVNAVLLTLVLMLRRCLGNLAQIVK